MNLSDFATGRANEPYDECAINRAYADAMGWDANSPQSFNDMPEPWASLKAEATRLNTEAHEKFMARFRYNELSEWELRGSPNGE